jgi:TatD DNase family protein
VADLIDTHAHLDAEQFAADLPEVLARALAAGVRAVVAVGTTAATSRGCLDLAAAHAFVHPTVGIHPNEIPDAAPGDWDRIVALASTPGVVGIGETGLDRHWDTTPFAVQEEWFGRHLELGRRLDRAVVIHCREAEADMLRVLRGQFDAYGPIRGVMHSFAGSQEFAERCLGMGLHISFSGMLTYKNAADLRAVAARLPDDRILVETDCPYLSPVPLRGKRNEPANVVHTARCLAEQRGVTLERVGEMTSRNAWALFGLA